MLSEDDKRKLDYEIRLVCYPYLELVDEDDLIDYVVEIIQNEYRSDD